MLNSGEYNAQHEDLQKKLVAGSGAPDIAAIDEGFIVQFRSQADKFVNLLDKGAGARTRTTYLAWKWKQSLSADGKTQIGLGTDVGGLAMCYRTDLFKAAGLPTERDSRLGALADLGRRSSTIGQKYVAGRPARSSSTTPPTCSTRSSASSRSASSTTSETLKMDGGPKVAFDLSHQGDRRRPVGQPRPASRRSGTRASSTATSPCWPARPGCSATSRTPRRDTSRASGTSPRSPAAAATGAARS